MAEKYRFLNPYNFVRNLMKARPAEHVLGNCLPPPHDRYVGLTGRLTCELKTVTPLFISDSHAVRTDAKGENNPHKIYRFFQCDGEPVLPGSSLRGMIRSVFETITNSCLGAFEKDGRPLEHRVSRAPDMTPARVVAIKENEVILEELNCLINPPPQMGRTKVMSPAGVVSDAYPPRVFDSERKTPYDPARSQLPPGVCDGMRVAALISVPKQNLSGPNAGRGTRPIPAYRAIRVVPVDQYELLTETEDCRKVFGWLHITGPNIENKHSERLFFRWDDQSPDPPTLDQIPSSYVRRFGKEVMDEYNDHLKGYWERLQGIVEKLGERRWPDSTEGLPQPSTFVEKDRSLRDGDLVYIVESKDPLKTWLRPVSMPRIRYSDTRESLLPEHLQHCESVSELCPACRVFGWVAGKREEGHQTDPDEAVAYAGRIWFSHGERIQEGRELPETTLGILSTPKPTVTPFYLLDAQGRPDPMVTYDTQGARLRGRKFYRHHGRANPAEYQGHSKSDQNRTIRKALEPGAVFQFTVEFENLAGLELGALLYSLELEEGMVHRLGYAKPFGFGSVKISVKGIEIMNWGERLQSLDRDAGLQKIEDTQFKQTYKQKYREEMCRLYGQSFEEMMTDLKALLKDPPDLPIHYPRPTRVPDPNNHPQFEWFVGNNRRRHQRETCLRSHGQQSKRGLLPDPVALDLACDDHGLPLIDKRGNDG
nr:TIGR03986 family CRISPR-associated RAMP protein [Kyrpidia tusciae]